MSGAELELRIDALAAGGDGVGRAPDGRVVFVPFAAPGDRLRVRLIEAHARFARGEIAAVLEPGAERTAPRCPVFGECGGCAWQHVGYAAQVEAKRAILRDALVRVGGLREVPEIDVTPSPAAYGYRGRARVQVIGGQVGFRRRRSHVLCAVRACPVLVPALDTALAALSAAPPARDGEWELALGAEGEVRASPLAGAAAAPGGGERLALRAGGERLAVSPGVFAQANAWLLDALAGAVCEAAGQGEELLELFAGAGFFTLGLARRFARVVAVEADPAAFGDLVHNTAGLDGVRAALARVEAWLAAGGAAGLAPEVVVLDPPRAGLGRAASERLAALSARRVVYLSCDPATLARDLAVLAGRGFGLAAVRGFDLFPQTPHVEALAVLDRDG